MAKGHIDPRDIAALGVTNQRETAVVWDRKTGQPIHNAIVWQDTRTAETTALGAAYAAGLAVGFWSREEDLRVNWGKDKEWTPQMDAAQREKLYANWKKAVARTLDWA